MAMNGSLKKAKKPQSNGFADTKMNGHYGKIEETRAAKQQKRPRRTYKAAIVSTSARLLLYYAVITSLFRCPASPSELTDDSPRICQPYLQARSYAIPYVEPYYNTYLASYVDTARPYVETVNQKAFSPAAQFTKQNYATYGAPRVEQVQLYAQSEWDRTIKPQLDIVQGKAWDQYNVYLHPYVGTVTDAVGPYYETASKTAVDQYHSTLLPAYKTVLPYAQQGYSFGHYYTTKIIFPYARWTEATLRSFLARTVWPRLRVLYGDNVEPQLMRISERLGRYKDSKRLEAVVDAVESSTIKSSVSTESISSQSVAESLSISNDATTASSSTANAKPTYNAAETRDKIANDLRTWQEKFAAAADKGSDDLEERVEEITKSQIRNQAHSVGNALVIELEEASKSATQDVKTKIQSIIKDVPEDPTETEADNALESAIDVIRSAGLLIKQKAMAVRNWKQKYDKETYNLVHDASSSTLDVIDNIRDLGLQEIGMRWAWMDGVTYKDWQKYHKLKKTFDEWRNEVQARAYDHTGLVQAKAEGQKQEDEAMDIASAAATELGRLKNSAKWKIWAQDSTDDFSDRKVPARVFKVTQSLSSKASEASESIVGTSQGSVESIDSVASESLDSVSSRISSSVVGKETGSVESPASKISGAVVGSQGSAESVASVVSEKARSVASSASQQGESAASKASSAIVGSQNPAESVASVAKSKASSIASEASSAALGSQDPIESASSVAGEKAQSVASQVSEAVAGSQGTIESVASKASEAVVGSQGTVESLSSVASKSAQSVLSAANKKAGQATDSIKGSPAPVASQASSSAESLASVVSEAAESPKKVWGGAMAQKVSNRQPILDEVLDHDEDSYSVKLQSLLSGAGDKASEITDAINDALSRATATSTQGSVESAKSLAGVQYEKVFSVVSTVLYGTTQGAGESVSSVASENYAAAVTAASYAIYGTPAPILSSLSSQAAASYSAAIAAAAADYEQAKSIVSAQVSGGKTEKRYEIMLSSAEQIYSDSIATASRQWQAVSQAVRPLQAPLESVSSVAASRLSEGLSLASAQYTNAKIAAGLQPTPATQKYLSDARRRYYEGIGQAHARYSEFLEEASGAIYGTPTPVYESVISAAQSQYSVAISEASLKLQSAKDAFSGSTKGSVESLLDVDATSHFNAALAAATEALSGASARASEAIYGSPQGAAESIASQLSQQAEHAASVVSSGVIGTETTWTESVASQASENWEALVSRASEQVYGQPTPFAESLLSQAGAYGSQAGEYGAQATEAAAAQFASVQALISELVIGQEPGFTDSVLSRFHSAYPTGVPALASSASSYASDAYVSASSVITSVFTPPPSLEAILDSANDQLNSAVDALSAQIYGTEKGYLEKASEAAGSAYDAAQTKASEAVYGTQGGYAEQAQASLVDVAASAQSAISIAFYGTPTGTVESATDVAANAYASVQSVLSENIKQAGDVAGDSYEAARAKISSAVYGPEAGALESAQARVAAAVESAKARLSELAAAGGEQAQQAKESLEEVVEQVAAAASSVTARVKDEL